MIKKNEYNIYSFSHKKNSSCTSFIGDVAKIESIEKVYKKIHFDVTMVLYGLKSIGGSIDISNYSLNEMYFSIHLPETDNLLKLLNNKKYDNVKVQLVSKKFNYTWAGEVSYNRKFCKYPIVSIPLELASRYLQKPEKWTCTIKFMSFVYEFNLTGNLPAAWC